jgi:predicted MarR family transcription regulator
MTDWNKVAQDLQLHMKRKEPQIKVRDVMQLFGLASTSSADYYLTKLEEIGAVRRVDNGKTSLWFLNWKKQ